MIGELFGALAALTISSNSLPANLNASSQSAIKTLPISQDSVRPEAPVKKRQDSMGVKTTAPSVFVADVASGKVLFSKNAYESRSIASLTKLVTAIVVLDQKPDLKQKIIFSEDDFDGESKPVFAAGEALTIEDVLKSMLVGSINASANALARYFGGKDNFVILMNEKIKSLGLKSPELVEPSGINPRNRADAADLAAIISTAAGYPEIREYAKLETVTVYGNNGKNAHVISSTNLLLQSYLNKGPFRIVMAKTGSLPEAGYCMAQITSQGSGKEVVAVELGSDNHFSRYQDIKILTAWAFDTYEWR
ncbi:MAG: serine hydrolase [Patescibacteria group bacterium]